VGVRPRAHGRRGFITYSFVGMVVPGIFGYYATRPIDRRIETVVDSEGLSASLTVLVVLVPLVAVLFYAGFRIFTQARDTLGGATAFGALEDGSWDTSRGGSSSLTALLSRTPAEPRRSPGDHPDDTADGDGGQRQPSSAGCCSSVWR